MDKADSHGSGRSAKSSFPVVLSLVAALAVSAAGPAEACNVPVFRYALEQWTPDPYEVEVVHTGPLTGRAKAAADLLAAAVEEDVPANIKIRMTDVSGESPAGGQPRIFVRFPQSFRVREILWNRPLTPEAVKGLLASPLRAEVARRLRDGDSAVWVFLESGDKTKDDAALALLTRELKSLEAALKLPEDLAVPAGAGGADVARPRLRLKFSLVRLARDDPEEAFLAASLLGSESDLRDTLEPMVFPVFGRGRVLYALVGKGIIPANIREACEFVAGPCTCLVKEENPGVDLLMSADWSMDEDERLYIEAPPMLAGVGALDAPRTSSSAPPPGPAQRSSGRITIWVGILGVLGALLIGVVIVTVAFYFLRR